MRPFGKISCLVFLLMQWCEGVNIYCAESVKSAVEVDVCPTTKEERDTAARKKNCEQQASRQNCSTADKFKYHCVINSYLNQTLEVCAPEILILGHCTEFNVVGGIIQLQATAPCNNATFPRCDQVYLSSEAYKYQDCYKLVNRTSSIPLTPETSQIKAIRLLVAVFITVITFIALLVFVACTIRFRRVKLCQKKRKETKQEQVSYKELAENKTSDDFKDEKSETTVPLIQKSEQAMPEYVLGPVEKSGFAECKTLDDLKEENLEKSQRYLKYRKKIDKYFVETKAYGYGEEIFKIHKTVVWTGRPGCGKTLAALHLILKHMDDPNADWTFRKLSSCDELSYIETGKKSLIFIDNIFYQGTMDSDIGNWWTGLTNIHKSQEYNENNLCFIFTARKTDIERAVSCMDNVTPILCNKRWANLDILTESEPEEILQKQIDFAVKEKDMKVPIIDKEIVLKRVRVLDGPIGFPFCAQLFVCSEEYRKSGVHFFSRPIKYLKYQIKDEIENDKSNRTKSLFFVLFFHEWHTKSKNAETLQIDSEYKCKKFLDNISPDLRKHFEPFDFRNLEIEAERLGAFLQKESKNVYRFVHDSVYEAVGAFLCEQHVADTAKYFPLEVIYIQEYKNLPEDQAATLALRLLYDSLHQRLSQVFACKVFQNTRFVDIFSSELQKKEDKTIGLFFTVANESSPVKLPCLFWTSYNKLARLTDKCYDIVKEKNIDPVFQLYVSLYGECCAGNEPVLNKINGMLRNNIAEIRNRVLNFKDDDGDSILHLLIKSERSDEFICAAVDQLLKDGINVDRRNKNKMTPLMFAVDQTNPRDKVVKKLISPRVDQTDSQKRTVFHHCLDSCNDDETCATYLNIILSCKDAEKCLPKSDADGNTALCIAAMETNYSRIISILILLESCSKDIIATVNDDGFSPLHLSARSLRGDSPYIELECCVRVILFLLYGGTTDNKSDRNADAIEECEYDLVKSILKIPNDETEMTKALDSLLGKCEGGRSEMKVKSSLLPTFPKHISKDIQTCIKKATQILQNKTFRSAN